VKATKSFVILILGATTVGGAALAWRQYAELVELRAATMSRDERADMQKRLWDLEKLNRELQDQLAAQRLGGAMDNLLAEVEEERSGERSRGERGRGGRGDPRGGRGEGVAQQFSAIRELVNKPEVQAMISLQQKAAIEARYAALFKNLNLQPEQVDKLKSLLAERLTTMQDVMTAAHEQGINPRENPDSFRKLLTDAQNEINNGIKSVIGDSGFAQLQTYEQTLPQRNLVNDLQQRLSYTGMPLTASQAEQLVQILAANTPQRPTVTSTTGGQPSGPPTAGFSGRGGPGSFGGPGGSWGGRGGDDMGRMIGSVLGGGPPGGFDGGGRGGSSVTVTPAAVSQAQTILAPPQLAALQQIQQQQQTQQQLRQLVTETLAANQPTTTRSAAPTAGSATGTTGSTSGPATSGTTGTGSAPPRKRGPGGE
jgi:hypothetical protein